MFKGQSDLHIYFNQQVFKFFYFDLVSIYTLIINLPNPNVL